MPPRKSTASNPPDEPAETTPAKAAKDKDRDSIGVEDLTLPKSMIARLAKGVLPPNTQIQKDALLALHKSATVFVSYIASNSNELAHMAGKKTVQPQDVLSALKDAELADFLPRLEAELKKYNEIQCDKRNSYRHRVKAEKAATTPADATADGEAGALSALPSPSAQLNGSTNGHITIDDDAEPPAKKMKGAEGTIVLSPGAQAEDEDMELPVDEAMEGDDVDDDEAEDEAEDDDADDQDGPHDETMEEVEDEEEEEILGNVQDEALDGGDESD